MRVQVGRERDVGMRESFKALIKHHTIVGSLLAGAVLFLASLGVMAHTSNPGALQLKTLPLPEVESFSQAQLMPEGTLFLMQPEAQPTVKAHARYRLQDSRWSESYGNTIIPIDTHTRIIGGTEKEGRMPGIKLAFTAQPKHIPGQMVRLKIGHLSGFNTPQAHAMGENTSEHISSPAVVKINGKKVKYFYTNVDGLELPISKAYLNPNGFNVIQIDAGYYFEDRNKIAYDKLKVKGLALLY